jgi:hypothetical protein
MNLFVLTCSIAQKRGSLNPVRFTSNFRANNKLYDRETRTIPKVFETNKRSKHGKKFDAAADIGSEEPSGFRINRCFPQFSRVQADRAIAEGRVTVNGLTATFGTRLSDPNDELILDGNVVVPWVDHVRKHIGSPYPEGLKSDNGFVYIKYFKGPGVTTTTSLRDPDGILNTGHFWNVQEQKPETNRSSIGSVLGTTDMAHMKATKVASRLLPVGRLDNASAGVIILTSDARLPAWLLGANSGCSKVRVQIVFIAFCIVFGFLFTLCCECSFQ